MLLDPGVRVQGKSVLRRLQPTQQRSLPYATENSDSNHQTRSTIDKGHKREQQQKHVYMMPQYNPSDATENWHAPDRDTVPRSCEGVGVWINFRRQSFQSILWQQFRKTSLLARARPRDCDFTVSDRRPIRLRTSPSSILCCGATLVYRLNAVSQR